MKDSTKYYCKTCEKKNTRRGVSEILAVMIVLMVSLIASVSIYNLAITSFNRYADDYSYQVDSAQQRIEERFTVVSIYENDDTFVEVNIYNYGNRDLSIDTIYVEGEQYDFDPDNIMISAGDIVSVELEASAPKIGSIVIVTEGGSRYETYYDTS